MTLLYIANRIILSMKYLVTSGLNLITCCITYSNLAFCTLILIMLNNVSQATPVYPEDKKGLLAVKYGDLSNTKSLNFSNNITHDVKMHNYTRDIQNIYLSRQLTFSIDTCNVSGKLIGYDDESSLPRIWSSFPSVQIDSSPTDEERTNSLVKNQYIYTTDNICWGYSAAEEIIAGTETSNYTTDKENIDEELPDDNGDNPFSPNKQLISTIEGDTRCVFVMNEGQMVCIRTSVDSNNDDELIQDFIDGINASTDTQPTNNDDNAIEADEPAIIWYILLSIFSILYYTRPRNALPRIS